MMTELAGADVRAGACPLAEGTAPISAAIAAATANTQRRDIGAPPGPRGCLLAQLHLAEGHPFEVPSERRPGHVGQVRRIGPWVPEPIQIRVRTPPPSRVEIDGTAVVCQVVVVGAEGATPSRVDHAVAGIPVDESALELVVQ